MDDDQRQRHGHDPDPYKRTEAQSGLWGWNMLYAIGGPRVLMDQVEAVPASPSSPSPQSEALVC